MGEGERTPSFKNQSGILLPDVQYYIFDIDGTLVRYLDSVRPDLFLHNNFLFPVLRDMMVERGMSRKEAEEGILKLTCEVPFWDYTDVIAEFALPAAEAWRRLKAWHEENLVPCEDAVRSAKELYQAGKTLFVVSNNPYSGCCLKLMRCGLADEYGATVFRRIFGTDKLRGCKNRPEVWKRLLSQLPIDPAEICTVGDDPAEDGEIPQSAGIGHSVILPRTHWESVCPPPSKIKAELIRLGNREKPLAAEVTAKECTAALVGGNILIQASSQYPMVGFSGFAIPAAEYNTLSISYRARGAISENCHLLYRKRDQIFSYDQRWNLPEIIADGKEHSFNLTGEAIFKPWTWGTSGEVMELWLELVSGGKTEFELCEIRFGKSSAYEIAPRKIIAQITDPQIGFQDYDREFARFRQEIDMLNAGDYQCVILCGDLMHHPSREGFQVFRQELERLRMPCFIVPGNHDGIDREKVRLYEEYFGPRFYAKDLPFDGWRFIGLDTNLWQVPQTDAERLESMEKMLKTELEAAAKNGKKSHYRRAFAHFRKL